MPQEYTGIGGEFKGKPKSKKPVKVELTVSKSKINDLKAKEYLNGIVTQYPDLLISNPDLSNLASNKISFHLASVSKELDPSAVKSKVDQYVHMYEGPFKVSKVEAKESEEIK